MNTRDAIDAIGDGGKQEMVNSFWHNLVWSYHEGVLHEWFFKDGITFATWGLAIATLLLVLDSRQKSKEQRERWLREDRHRESDRADEQKRRRWDEQFHRLRWLDSQFNSPGMIVARKRMATEMQENKLSKQLGKPTSPIWPVVAFMTQVASLCEEALLDIHEVDLVYRDYVMFIWTYYGKFLESAGQNGQYLVLRRLKDRLSSIPSNAFIDGELAAGVSYVHDEFLAREARL